MILSINRVSSNVMFKGSYTSNLEEAKKFALSSLERRANQQSLDNENCMVLYSAANLLQSLETNSLLSGLRSDMRELIDTIKQPRTLGPS